MLEENADLRETMVRKFEEVGRKLEDKFEGIDMKLENIKAQEGLIC